MSGDHGNRSVARAERYLPALLDRLESRAGAGKAMNRTEYQASLLRDLRWLLNCTVSVDPRMMSGFEQARSSVLNYGMPPITGASLTQGDLPGIALGIKEAIERFEPRLMPGSVQVEPIGEARAASHNQVVFRITARYWFEPYPVELALRAQWDLDNGLVDLNGA